MMLVLYGPTAVGKTSFALRLAKNLNAEIISADSRQVYKNLDIGSGKVSFENKVKKHKGYWTVDGVRVNGFDLASPGQKWNVADFLTYALKEIKRINSKKKIVIVAGGTGFYIHSLLYGLESIGVPEDKSLRAILEKMTATELFNKLKQTNPQKASLLNESDKKNPRRIIRAIEISLFRGKNRRINSQFTKEDICIGLSANNEYLYKKSDMWLKERLKNGLIEEIKSLVSSGVNAEWLKSLGLEYRWLTRYVKGEISYDQALKGLMGDTHSFIRRQKTWFKKFQDIKVFNVNSKEGFKSAEKEVLNWIELKKSF